MRNPHKAKEELFDLDRAKKVNQVLQTDINLLQLLISAINTILPLFVEYCVNNKLNHITVPRNTVFYDMCLL